MAGGGAAACLALATRLGATPKSWWVTARMFQVFANTTKGAVPAELLVGRGPPGLGAVALESPYVYEPSNPYSIP